MDQNDYAIETFGCSIQIDKLRFNEHNVVFLAVEKIGALLIECYNDLFLVYLAAAIPAYQHDAYSKALQLCHFEQGMPLDVAVGHLPPDMLTLVIRLSAGEITAAKLNQAVKLLFYLHGAVCDQ